MALSDGLVGYWSPWLGSSGYRLLDRTGRGNHGTLTNMDAGTDWVGATIQGQSGFALDFDSTDDFVDLGSRILLTDDPWSVFGWVRFRTNDTWKAVATKVNLNNTNRQLFIGLNGGFGPPTGGLTFATNFGANASIGTSALTTNRWYFYCATHQGTSSTANNLVVISAQDGSMPMTRFAGSGNGGVDADGGTNTIKLARFHATQPMQMDGQQASFAIVNRILTDSEIRTLYNLGPGWYRPYAKRGYGYALAGFKAYWHRRETQLIGGGLR